MAKQPTLAIEAVLDKLVYPFWGSIKLDGIRVWMPEGKPLTRTMKEVPNRFTFNRFSHTNYFGLDGEMVMGDPTAEDCYRKTYSAVMGRAGEPELDFYVFDQVSEGVYEDRYRAVERRTPLANVIVVDQHWIENRQQLDEFEDRTVQAGHEGVMLRKPAQPYHYGKPGKVDPWMLKVKRFTHDEAEVLAVYEQMTNTNEKVRDERGYAKRSTSKEGLVPSGMAGGFTVRMLNGRFAGVTTDIGRGTLTLAERKALWEERETLPGRICRVKHFEVGATELPRFGAFAGWRAKEDM